MNSRFLQLLLFTLAFCSCQNAADKVRPRTAEDKAVKKTQIPLAGEVINSVALQDAPGESYALYIPPSLSQDSLRPVLIFFDPHGNGNFPLRKYRELAEKHGFILMGSNNSKNGLSFQETATYAANLVKEAREKFQPTSISFCGFSGGAKVALMAGTNLSDVDAVVYCGAAIPVEPNHPIRLLGFAGTADMNYTDVVSFEWELDDPQIEHYLIEWDGGHEFPAPEVFEDAFTFLKTGTIENLSAKGVSISRTEVAREQQVKQEYIQAFQAKDLEWWQQTTDSLETVNSPMSKRLLGFISLACYSFSSQALQQNKIPMAEKILAIYRMADPDNEAILEFEQQLNTLR